MFAFFSPIRKLTSWVFLSLSAVLLAACDPSLMTTGGQTGPTVNTSKPVQVALLVPGGSANSGDVSIAESLENSARLAMADLNGVEIDLRVYNTAGNPQQAAAMAVQAVSDGAKIILGPLFGEASNAAGVAVASTGVNVLSFSNNAAIAGGNVYILGNTFRNTAARLTGYARSQGKSRIMVIHARNVAGEAGRAAILQAMAEKGITPAGVNSYEFSQDGVLSAVNEVRATAKSSGADAIFFTSDTAGALPLFAQLLPEAGIDPATTQYMGLTRWDIPAQTLDLPGIQGGWFALPDPQKTVAYRQRYLAAYGDNPHPLGSLAYDGIAAIGALVANGGSTPFSGASLTQQNGFQGTSGVFRLRQNGTNDRGMAVATIRDKQVVVIDSAPQSFGGAGF